MSISTVGFGGRKGSGKTEACAAAARALGEITGETWWSASFLDGPTSVVASVCGVRNWWVRSGRECVSMRSPLRPEDLPIPLEKTCVRDIDAFVDRELHSRGIVGAFSLALRSLESPDYWIRCLEGYLADGYGYVIDDVTFPTEFEWIRDVRMGIVGAIRTPDGRDVEPSPLDHCTAWHFEIVNDFGAGLSEHVRDVMETFFSV